MIKLQIIGSLGKDAAVNTVNGKNVINFSVAHSEKNKDGESKTTWVDCSWWMEKTAVVQYLVKGKLVFVEGTPDVRSYNRNDGTTGASLNLRVRELQLLGGKENSGYAAKNEEPIGEPIDSLTF